MFVRGGEWGVKEGSCVCLSTPQVHEMFCSSGHSARENTQKCILETYLMHSSILDIDMLLVYFIYVCIYIMNFVIDVRTYTVR